MYWYTAGQPVLLAQGGAWALDPERCATEEYFGRIILSNRMFRDHLAASVESSLDAVLARSQT